MRIAVGADHAGFALKLDIVEMLRERGHDVVDVGPREHDPLDDYPDFAKLVAERAAFTGEERHRRRLDKVLAMEADPAS